MLFTVRKDNCATAHHGLYAKTDVLIFHGTALFEKKGQNSIEQIKTGFRCIE